MISKKHSPGRFLIIGFCIILAVIVADQYSKWLVMETMLRVGGDTPSFGQWFVTGKPIPSGLEGAATATEYAVREISPNLTLRMVWNCGISFGMLDSCGQGMQITLIGLALCISLALLIWMAIARHVLIGFAVPLIVGGAVANVIDRIRFKAVADFVDVYYGQHHWPAFNLADACIVVGAILLGIDAIFNKDGAEPQKKKK
ncbi:MAG: signal peptidase II [Alphaproteobacteria bacterium]